MAKTSKVIWIVNSIGQGSVMAFEHKEDAEEFAKPFYPGVTINPCALILGAMNATEEG